MDIILGHHLVSYSVMKTDFFFEENAINSTNEMGKKNPVYVLFVFPSTRNNCLRD